MINATMRRKIGSRILRNRTVTEERFTSMLSGASPFGFAFKEYSEESLYFFFGQSQSTPTGSRGPVNSSDFAGFELLAGAQESFLLHTVQQRIQSSRAEPVTMPSEFFDHSKTKDAFRLCVVQDMETNEAGIELSGLNIFLIGQVVHSRDA